jgi:hypothetical protein
MAYAVAESEDPTILAKQEHGTPHSPVEAGGDAAAGSPAASIAAVPEEKGASSSPEDASSVDESPCGDGHTITMELPVDNSLPKWWMFGQCTKIQGGKGQCLTSLTCHSIHMSLG